MEKKRTAYAPFSLTSEAGVGQTPVEGYIDVNQMIYPSVDTGVIDENGEWKGVKANDKEFIAFTKDETVPNGAVILTPSANPNGTWPLDMTGYNDIFLAVKPSEAGNYAIKAVMGPDSVSFANLNPVNAAATLTGTMAQSTPVDFESLFEDGTVAMTADVWNIFIIGNNLRNQKLLQFKITNNTGSEAASIECAFMRLV